MNQTTLHVSKQFPSRIIAPTWCPYKESYSREDLIEVEPGLLSQQLLKEYIVHPALCPLCRICDFVPESSVLTVPITRDERDRLASYLVSGNVALSQSILGQQSYLQRNDKLPLAILLSAEVLDNMLASVFDEDRRVRVRAHIIVTQEPICHAFSVPVYFSSKLTKSPVQVVGEVQWRA